MRDKAFRERLAQSLNRLRKNVYLSHAVPKRLSPAHYEDLVRVKLAYMDEHPIDDDEPLDADRVMDQAERQACPTEVTCYEEFFVVIGADDGTVTLRFYPHTGFFRLRDEFGNLIWLSRQPETRGDLRRLCAALNIELKEE